MNNAERFGNVEKDGTVFTTFRPLNLYRMRYHIGDLEPQKLIDLYKGMLKPRMIEEKMLVLLRQGKISKWFSGIGQEAVSVGVVYFAHAPEPWGVHFPKYSAEPTFCTVAGKTERFHQWQGS